MNWRRTFVCLFAASAEARTLTIEEFGGLPDSQIHLDGPNLLHGTFCQSLEDNAMALSASCLYPEFMHSSLKDNNNRFDLSASHQFKHRAGEDEKVVQQARKNTQAYNSALSSAKYGDVILLHENESYSFIGGIEGVGLNGLTLDFAGYTRFIFDLEIWPMRDWSGGSQWEGKSEYAPGIDLKDCSNMVITCSASEKAIVKVDYEKNEIYVDSESGSGGIIDGHGKKWWDIAIAGEIEVESRPRLVDIRSSMNITVEHLTLVNSPYWTLTLESIEAEVHHVNVLIDRKYQRHIVNNTMTDDLERFIQDLERSTDKKGPTTSWRHLRSSQELGKFHFPTLPDWILQPQNLNTDGIDPIGENIYIHDCIILNDDDSIAVKPPINGKKGYVLNGTIPYECTRNVTVENIVATGFGLSIGSVGPNENHPCVDNVKFSNVKMPGTGKGIYIKSNKSDCKGNVSSKISNILYENVHIKQPIWWPIWIGPQQQHEPHQSLGGACSLEYPLHSSRCPTQGCASFENITLRNILIEDPLLSPGVILGNETNPMKNLVFDNVTMTVPLKYYLTHGRLPFYTKRFPYTGRFECANVANGISRGSNPVPDCFETVD
eukprot:884790_1